MKNVVKTEILNTETGILNEFENFYSNVELLNINSNEIYDFIEIYDLIKGECPEEILYSPEFWCAKFSHKSQEYYIAADGEMGSSGTYFLAEIREYYTKDDEEPEYDMFVEGVADAVYFMLYDTEEFAEMWLIDSELYDSQDLTMMDSYVEKNANLDKIFSELDEKFIIEGKWNIAEYIEYSIEANEYDYYRVEDTRLLRALNNNLITYAKENFNYEIDCAERIVEFLTKTSKEISYLYIFENDKWTVERLKS